MWLRGGLTLVSRPQRRVLPWTWSPAVEVGEGSLCGSVVEPTLFTELSFVLSGVRVLRPSRGSPTNIHPQLLTGIMTCTKGAP